MQRGPIPAPMGPTLHEQEIKATLNTGELREGHMLGRVQPACSGGITAEVGLDRDSRAREETSNLSPEEEVQIPGGVRSGLPAETAAKRQSHGCPFPAPLSCAIGPKRKLPPIPIPL